MTPPTQSGYRRAFISHAHTDNEICARYAAALRARGIDCWLDLDDAQKGYALSEDIEQRLEGRPAFILMVTAASNASHWVALELGNYIALWADKPTHQVDGLERLILPVRLEAVPIPVRVRGFNWIDGVGQPFEQVVDQLVRALAIPSTHLQPAVSSPAPPAIPMTSLPQPGEPAPTPAPLARLGFAARRVNGVEIILPPLCDVPAGDFLMGSDPRQDQHAAGDEQPQYVIPMPYSFQIARFPVTVAEYACFVRAGHASPSRGTWQPITWDEQLRWFDHPIVCVSWHKAVAYSAWMAALTSLPWRLPTEEEWEKAARWDPDSRQSRLYPWGDTFEAARCNTATSGRGSTSPVGTYPSGASPCGAEDMAGNVWEWTSSAYQAYPFGAANETATPADTVAAKVLRGGAWTSGAKDARAAFRYLNAPDTTYGTVGFRMALGAIASKRAR